MQLTLELDIPKLSPAIQYTDRVLLIGSCFTENMSERLVQHKFKVLSNPHGILFNPLSVAHSLDSYVDDKRYAKEDLFYLNELYNSWDHHTRFSDVDADQALENINSSQQAAARFIRGAKWIVITLGSAFQYYLVDDNRPVANNHRAPSQWFQKRLLDIDVIETALSNSLDKIIAINPEAQFLFTISPVRHIRDGVVDNNRSKSRLIESVHHICAQYQQAHYFPAYELIIDILRDYRYYDIDFVHPNFLATAFVWEQLLKAGMDAPTQQLMKEVRQISIAREHRSRFPETEAHKRFLSTHAQKVKDLLQRYPFLDLGEELQYFSASL